MLPNIPEFVYFYFAILELGAIVVPINTSSTPAELLYLLNNSDAKIIIAQTSAEKSIRKLRISF